MKGVEIVREASRILRETAIDGLSYHGFVEGDDGLMVGDAEGEAAAGGAG